MHGKDWFCAAMAPVLLCQTPWLNYSMPPAALGQSTFQQTPGTRSGSRLLDANPHGYYITLRYPPESIITDAIASTKQHKPAVSPSP